MSRSTELLERPHRRFSLGKRATVTRHHRRQLRARAVGGVDEAREHGEFVWQRRSEIAVELQYVAGAVERVRDQAAGDRGPDRMKLIFEGRRHAEVSATTSNGPEQIGQFILARLQHLAFGGNKFNRPKIVECQAVLAHQPAQSTAECESRDASGRHHTARDRQAVQLRLAVELGPGDAALGPHGTGVGVDVDAFHRRQVDHQPAIDGGAPGHVVAAATDRHLESSAFARG